MKKSFYHYLMKYRQVPAPNELASFANAAFDDHSFPKSSSDYDELSRYLEMNGHYLASMSVFDEAWEKYNEEESK
ncbi:MAG TPA: YozE family protein [Chondromyces sp.]|nr:YozE family protein [Chondromyces sp.]